MPDLARDSAMALLADVPGRAVFTWTNHGLADATKPTG